MQSDCKRCGATPEEWATFDVLMGLTVDLLPVVSNPNAVISADSKMKDKGKVPSHYNRHGEVVGIAEWTKREASALDIERWMKRPDYGICIQTREVRALDIDVPNHEAMSAIVTFVDGFLLNIGLPRRTRATSEKCLLAFRLPGNMPKRVIKVREKVVCLATGKTLEPAWLIEFLATGQQFVAAGTHSSGARIEWEWHGHEGFPEITLDQFNALWAELEKQFACEPSSVGSIRKRGEAFESNDDTANMLVEKGLVLDYGNDGQLFIECPWKGDHSMDSGVTETAYFPRGSGGYDLGHFVCMHAGCKSHSDTDFEEMLGLRDDMFEVVTVSPGQLPSIKFQRNKLGQIEAVFNNVLEALKRPDFCHVDIRYDSFRDEIMLAMQGKAWRALTDTDYSRIQSWLENRGFKPLSIEMISRAVRMVAEDNHFDSAIEWLKGLPEWDGESRVDDFFARYFGAAPSKYATAVGRYLWTAMAGRCLVPGIKADMMPILEGEQGIVKSTAIAALVPIKDLFVEVSFNETDDNLARKMRGRLVAEVAELRGLHTRELETIKAFITRTHENWVPKYREFAINYPRRLLLIGSTNQTQFLADETGNRRFLPMRVERADIVSIERDREQLWAEARELFTEQGILWADAQQLATAEHAKYQVHDAWEDIISEWLRTEDHTGEKPGQREYIRVVDVLKDALNLDAGQMRSYQNRITKVLKDCGYVWRDKWIDGGNKRVWVPREFSQGTTSRGISHEGICN